jgi:hypothetical protein
MNLTFCFLYIPIRFSIFLLSKFDAALYLRLESGGVSNSKPSLVDTIGSN